LAGEEELKATHRCKDGSHHVGIHMWRRLIGLPIRTFMM
jgi:hypothetical protein